MIVSNTPKMVREALCAAQSAIGAHGQLGAGYGAAAPGWIAQLGVLIAAVDEHRPLRSDGKHGDLHTDTCGCEDHRAPWSIELESDK